MIVVVVGVLAVAATTLAAVRRRSKRRHMAVGRTGCSWCDAPPWSPLEHQAGGRCATYGELGFFSSPDGAVVLKPLQSRGRGEREAAFITRVHREQAFAPLRRWVPKPACEGAIMQVKCRADGARASTTIRGIAMENIVAGMRRPCVLDAKLGDATCAEESTLEKRQRSDLLHGRLTQAFGFRLSGLRVFRALHGYYQSFDKFTLRQLDEDSMSLALRWFLDAGFVHLRTDVVPLLATLLRALAADVRRCNVRFVCSSVVLAYEGEPGAWLSVGEGRAWRVPASLTQPLQAACSQSGVRVALVDFPYAVVSTGASTDGGGEQAHGHDEVAVRALEALASLLEVTARELAASGRCCVRAAAAQQPLASSIDVDV